MVAAALAYLWYALIDGDYLNDYATHLPAAARPLLIIFGELIARFHP